MGSHGSGRSDVSSGGRSGPRPARLPCHAVSCRFAIGPAGALRCVRDSLLSSHITSRDWAGDAIRASRRASRRVAKSRDRKHLRHQCWRQHRFFIAGRVEAEAEAEISLGIQHHSFSNQVYLLPWMKTVAIVLTAVLLPQTSMHHSAPNRLRSS